MIKVYIASPYTTGDKQENVNLQIDAAAILLEHGYAPHVPLYNHYHQLRHPHTHQEWIKLDLVWLDMCDILIRIRPVVDGVEIPSSGADAEEAKARELNIPVFTFANLIELEEFLSTNVLVLNPVLEEGEDEIDPEDV